MSKKYNLIYLEDDNFYPEIIEMLLNNSEYSIIQKFNSKEDLFDNLSKTNYDIALLDLMIDNFELSDFLDYIKTVNPYAKLMILTTLLDGAILYKYKQLGIENIISKKELKTDLLPCLNSLVKNKSFYSPKILNEIEKYERNHIRIIKINEMLTKRQKQVFELILQKKNTNEIMDLLNLSQTTVFSYYKDIKDKINILISGKDKDFINYKKLNKIEELTKIV